MKILALLLVTLAVTSQASANPPPNVQARLDAWIKDQSGGISIAWIDAEGKGKPSFTPRQKTSFSTKS